MPCIYPANDFSSGLEDQCIFSQQMPYIVMVRQFSMAEIVPLHYTRELEIVVCDGLSGEMVIGSQHYPLNGQQVFAVPPYTVHASTIRPGDGMMRRLKINLEALNRYIHTENYLAIQNVHLHQIQYLCPDYQEISRIFEQLIRHDGDLMLCLGLLLQLLHILARNPVQDESGFQAQFRSSNLQELIRWTTENFSRKISIEEAAAFTGYNKYHFCCRFKSLTGMTYLQYLTSVRLSHACSMLLNGESIQTVSRACGFENTSYFIQVFKRGRNVTPHQYVLQQKKQNRNACRHQETAKE